MGGADSAWGDLYGAVDIWCPLFSLHRQESSAQRQALGETIWTYTALCQGPPTPWWHIDFPLLNYRVPAWLAWRNGMKGLLYWGGMSYWDKTDDPWTQAPSYAGNGRLQQGEKGIVFQGEGSLVYPAPHRGLRRHRSDDPPQSPPGRNRGLRVPGHFRPLGQGGGGPDARPFAGEVFFPVGEGPCGV